MSKEPARLEAKIDRVVVYEDRCEVTRRATFNFDVTGGHLLVRDISPLVDAKRCTVVATAEGGAAVAVDEVRVVHRWEREASDKEDRLEALRAEAESAERAAEAGHRKLKSLQTSAQGVHDLISRYFNRAGTAQWESGEGDRASYKRDFDTFASELARLNARMAEVRKEVSALEATSQDARAAVSKDRDRRERLSADLELSLSGGAGTVEITMSTVIPCGVWRPAHQAALLGDPASRRVRWSTLGTVWQRTGEDWNDVELILSTDRPSAGAELPSLDEDELYLRQKTAVERKTVFVEHRVEKASKADLGQGVPGVYDGGEARELKVEGRVSIKSDGRPHRVPIATFEADAAMDRVAMPDEAAQVYRRVRLENAATTPLLAGPVTLLEGGAYVGVSDINYVGPKERFELAFGTDDALRVKCHRRQEIEERRLTKDRTHFVTELELENTSAKEEAFNVVLRFPISEVAQLKVVPSMTWCTKGEPKPDADGLVHLPVTVKGGERQTLSVAFHFETSGDVQVPDPW